MNLGLKTSWIEKKISYTGGELRPHWILSQFKLQGSAVVAFLGACDVKTSELVDWEDRLANDHIRAAEMVHFIGEFFGPTLREGVYVPFGPFLAGGGLGVLLIGTQDVLAWIGWSL